MTRFSLVRWSFLVVVFVLALSLPAGRIAAQTHDGTMDHHDPTHPIEHPVTHHDDGGDPTMDHHFPHHDPVDPHHHVTDPMHDPDPHHGTDFQHHHNADTVHHHDHHHSDGMHHHHMGHEGDTNLDGHVNRTDVVMHVTHLGQQGEWTHGDFNGDGTVGLHDLSLLSHDIGTSHGLILPAGSANAVPEPSTLILTAVGAMGFLAHVWRKRRDRLRAAD
jgi:hypothetical protein